MALIVDRRGSEWWVWDTNTLDWVRGEQPLLEAGSVTVSGPIEIDDGGGSITVDGQVTTTPAVETSFSDNLNSVGDSFDVVIPSGYNGVYFSAAPSGVTQITVEPRYGSKAVYAFNLNQGIWTPTFTVTNAGGTYTYFVPALGGSTLTLYCTARTVGSTNITGFVSLSAPVANPVTMAELQNDPITVVPTGQIGILSQLDLTNSDPLTVAIVDSSGDQISSFGVGTEYADGAARGTATGTLAMGDDGTNIQSVKVDASGELQVDVLTLPAVTGTVTANQGTANTVANGWPVKITDGTDTVDVIEDGNTVANAKALMVAGFERITNKTYPIPVLGSSYTVPTSNDLAIPVDLRVNAGLHGSGTARQNMILVGGRSNQVTPVPTQFVMGNGETLAADPTSTFGVQAREFGQSFSTSGNISAVGQRFTVSSRYMVKGAALFNITEGNPWSGIIRPVVSIDNGTTWAFCLAINIDTGEAASSFETGNVAGTYSIPFGNGATDFGFQITSRQTGDLTFRVSANTVGIGAMFAITAPVGDTPVSGLVTDTPQSYFDGDYQPLSLTSEGRLRVSSYPASVPEYRNVTPNFDFFGSPYPNPNPWKE